jgi:hypothetical protein
MIDAEGCARDGAAVIRGAFAPWIGRLREGVEAPMADPWPRERSCVPEDGSARVFQDFPARWVGGDAVFRDRGKRGAPLEGPEFPRFTWVPLHPGLTCCHADQPFRSSP